MGAEKFSAQPRKETFMLLVSGGALSAMVILIRNGIRYPSSNPRQGGLCFTSC